MNNRLLTAIIVAIAALCCCFTTAAAQTAVPFRTTTVVDGQFAAGTPWYCINVRNGKYLYVDPDTHQIYCSAITPPTADRQEFLWAFTGNDTDGYRFHNYTTGAALCIGINTVEDKAIPTMGSGATYDTFRLTSNGDGFSISVNGVADVYLNDLGGLGVLGIWANAAGLASNGSRMIFKEVEMPDGGSTGGGEGGGTVVPQPDDGVLSTFTMLLKTAQEAYDANSAYDLGPGLIRNASQLYSPYSQNNLGTTPDGGGFDALIDGNASTYWHSYWQGGNVQAGTHYIRCTAPEDLGTFEGEYTISITRRNANNDHPTQFVVYGTNDYCSDSPYDRASWTEVGTIDFEAGSGGSTATATLYVDQPYRYLRFNCTATTSSRGYFHMAEFQISSGLVLSPNCPNALYPEAAAAMAQAIATAQAAFDAYNEGRGTITSDDVTALRQAINAYRAGIIVPITSLTIAPSTFTTYELGAQQALHATIQPNNASNTTLQWTTSDASVATVSSNGVVTTIGGGECDIIATTTDGSNRSARCHVTVYAQIDYSALCINEVQVANIDQYLDPSLNYGGWIELYNSSNTPIPLGGLYVVGTDHNGADEVPFRFLFPLDDRADYGNVPAHGYKNIWFDHYAVYDNKPITEHEAYKQVYWKLDPDGGHVALLAGDGQSVICSADYPAMPPRSSYARTTDGGDAWAWHACGTPEASNNDATDYLDTPRRLTAPDVSIDSQVNSRSVGSFYVTIPDGATLHYTTDGTTPNASSQQSKDGNFRLQAYGSQIYRFRLFQQGYLPSPVVTRSFIYSESGKNLPIIAVTTDNNNLNSYSYGILTNGTANGRPGQGASGKTNRNMDWERPINFEYFDLNDSGTAYNCVLNQETDFCVAGGWTRNSSSLPPFKIKAAEQYDGYKYLHYPIFKDKPYNKNRTLLLRRETDLLDVGLQEVARRSGLNIDTQAWEPGELFINGVSKGYIPIREPSNKHYALANYGIDTDLVDVFEVNCDSNYIQSSGTQEAFDRWYDLAERCGRDEEAYRELCSLVDIDEYLNYMAVEFYIFNADWPWNNVKGFRANDGKFHMILMDVGDQAFDHTQNQAKGLSPFEYFRKWQYSHYRPQLGETRFVTIFFNMMQHEAIRRRFVDTFCLVAYSVYDPDYISEIMNELRAECNYWITDNLIASKLTPSWQSNTIRQLCALPEAGVTMNDIFTINLATDTEGARLHLDGLPIPRQRFNGTLFAPATLSAVAPTGYSFVGWKDAEGTILSTDIDWTIAEGNKTAWGNVTASFRQLTPQDHAAPVRINEVSAANDMYVNELWDRKDWVELYNTTDEPIDVAGMYLSDNADKPTKWCIPAASTGGMLGASTANTVIPAHGTLIVWCDKEPAGQQLHASFKLSNTDGSVVTLQAADGSWTDTLGYNIHGGRESVGRYPDGSDRTCLFVRPTIDAPNYYGYFGFKSILPASIGQVAHLIDRALKGEATLSEIESLVGRVLKGE